MKNKVIVSKIFEAIKKRPLIHFGKIDLHSATCFIHGFYCGYNAASLVNPRLLAEARNKTLESRGWQVTAVCPEKEMEEKGMSVKEIINEILEVEIETWRLLEQSENE